MEEYIKLWLWIKTFAESYKGLFLILILVCYIVVDVVFPARTDTAFLVGGYTCILTTLIWHIETQRWFQRNPKHIWYISILPIAISVFFHLWLYDWFFRSGLVIPKAICTLTLLLILLGLSLGLYCILTHFQKDKQKLIIAFLVSNKSKHEKEIRAMLDECKDKIEERDNRIKIVIPPFGIANNRNACTRFLNCWFSQVDAIVCTKISDSATQEFGYEVSNFTSQIRKKIIRKHAGEANQSINFVLQECYKDRDWNTFHIKADNITVTHTISNYLYQILSLYVSCIYLYIDRYDDALMGVERLYSLKEYEGTRINALAQELLSKAYLLFIQTEIEDKSHDYNTALTLLNICADRVPYITSKLSYILLKARILFYIGKVKDSKKLTHTLCSISQYDWYMNINFGFYAIYEQKPLEVYYRYRQLLKSVHIPNKEEVNFAIQFQEQQLKEANDSQYKLYLLHGLAFLYLYTSKSESKKRLKIIAAKYAEFDDYIRLAPVRTLIKDSIGKLKISTVK